MESQAYLLFELNGSRYGVAASAVRELFFIPEITPIAEAPPFIRGVIDLRGEIVPILDIHQRLGQPAPCYQLTDSIVVLHSENHQLGMVVNRVQEVRMIAADQITTDGQALTLSGNPTVFLIAGLARLDGYIVTLLNPDYLLQQARIFAHEYSNAALPEEIGQEVQPIAGHLFAHLSPEARTILQERANHLRQVPVVEEPGGRLPVAVVGLGGEYLGFGLETVYEFINVQNITPIPCCPSYVVGNINLRGEIVTLLDISNIIHLSSSSSQVKPKAIVVRVNDIVAGIEVDEIFDVIHIRSSELASISVAVHSVGDEYLQGVAPYQSKLMSIINLPKMLTSGVLTVNEEV